VFNMFSWVGACRFSLFRMLALWCEYLPYLIKG
jgi:hypothetical protein